MRIPTLAALAALATAPAFAADPAAGERIYKAQCGACHSPLAGKNLVGPSLHDIVGRGSGAVAGFRYSAANKNANLTWDDATLDTYLTNPRAMIVGTTMTYVGLKDDTQRADLIAYLHTLK
jgi:cytochrome c